MQQFAASCGAHCASYEWRNMYTIWNFTSAKGLTTRNFLYPCKEDGDWHLYRAFYVWETLLRATNWSYSNKNLELRERPCHLTLEWIPFQKAHSSQNWPCTSQVILHLLCALSHDTCKMYIHRRWDSCGAYKYSLIWSLAWKCLYANKPVYLYATLWYAC